MDNPNLHSNGSVWRKWDLQVQTYLDPQWTWPDNYPAGKDKEIERQNKFNLDLINHCASNNITVVAITDHNTGRAIDPLLVKNHEMGEQITILPGVEVISSEGIHLIVIFDPGAINNRWPTWNETVNNFLTAISMPQPAFHGENNHTPATANCTAENIILKAREYNGVVIFAHAHSTNGGLFCKSDARTRKRLLEVTNILDAACELSNKKVRVTELETKLADHQYDIKNFAIINTSDSRKISNIGTKYSWIKADPTFEGLKQIIYEPKLRARVQQDNPSEEETYAKIEKLGVDFPNDLKIKDKESSEAISFCIQGKQEINFSSNLTCVIGGRGSGKSTLVHILYNLVSERDTDRLSEVNSPLFNLQLGSKDELGKIRSQTKSDIPSSTEFFLQNEVERFAKDISEMSKLIKTRLYGLSAIDDGQKDLHQIESEWQVTDTKVEELISAYDEMTRIDQQIILVKKQKDTLKKQTDVISSKDYKKLQKEIEEFANAISAFATYEKEYKRVSLEISTLIKSVSRLDWTKYGGQSVLISLSAELEKKKTEIQASFETATKKHAVADYTAKLNNKKTQLKDFLKEKGLSPENIGEIAAATQQIAYLDEQIKILQQEKILHQETYDRKESTLKAHREAYSSYQEVFKSVANKLQSDLGNLNFDDEEVNIFFHFKINDQLLKDTIADFVKNCNTSKISLRADSIQSVLFGNGNIPLSDIISDQSKIVEAVNSSEVADTHTQIIRELIGAPTFVEKLYLRMQQHHFNVKNIQVQTKLGEKLLQNTSFGERCGIVIAIVLVAGTNPIVIDQPEDNLDGKYVSKVLVPLIRTQKQKRQIILVTRDANIAIGGDSELILILDREDRGSVLLPATIENKVIRPKYIWILDGGEIAFKAREAKYCIQKGTLLKD